MNKNSSSQLSGVIMGHVFEFNACVNRGLTNEYCLTDGAFPLNEIFSANSILFTLSLGLVSNQQGTFHFHNFPHQDYKLIVDCIQISVISVF